MECFRIAASWHGKIAPQTAKEPNLLLLGFSFEGKPKMLLLFKGFEKFGYFFIMIISFFFMYDSIPSGCKRAKTPILSIDKSIRDFV